MNEGNPPSIAKRENPRVTRKFTVYTRARSVLASWLTSMLLGGVAQAIGESHLTSEMTKQTASISNRPPVLRFTYSGNNLTVEEGHTLRFRVLASDPDKDEVSLSATPLPSGARFEGGTFSWTPVAGFAATTPSYSITFSAVDRPRTAAASTTTQTLTIYIGPNQPPILDAISSPQLLVPGSTLKLPISAHDADGDDLKFIVQGLPPGATFKALRPTRHGQLRGVLKWKTAKAQTGMSYTTHVIVQEANTATILQSSQAVTFSLGEPNVDSHGCILPERWHASMKHCM